MKKGITGEQSALLKGLGILMMIYHHIFSTPELYGLEYYSVLRFGDINVELHLAWFCKICVGIFAFVSGYGMYYVLDKRCGGSARGETLTGYLMSGYREVLRRLGRFYIEYWYVLIIVMGLIFLFDPDAPAFDFGELLLNMLGISCSYNGSWWYVLQYVKMMLLLPLTAAFFHGFPNQAQEKRKWVFYISAAVIALLCLLVGAFWSPGLWNLMLQAGHGLRISFTLTFLSGYVCARFSVYQKLCKNKSRAALRMMGAAALIMSVTARILPARDASYAKLDFLIVPVFVFGVLTLTEEVPRLAAALRWFGGLSAYMWLVHIFFLREVFRPVILFTGVSTGIYLTLTVLAVAAAALLKVPAAVCKAGVKRRNRMKQS